MVGSRLKLCATTRRVLCILVTSLVVRSEEHSRTERTVRLDIKTFGSCTYHTTITYIIHRIHTRPRAAQNQKSPIIRKSITTKLYNNKPTQWEKATKNRRETTYITG